MTELISPGPAVEEWRPVPTLQHIEASSLGRIRYVGPKRRKIDTGHVFPQQTRQNGYKQVTVQLLEDGPVLRKTLKVHRLVALAFHGLPPVSDKEPVVGHLDDDKCNNRPENLRWMSQRENCNAPSWIAKRLGANNAFHGRKHSAETREKIGAKLRGRQYSPETRTKMSAAQHEAAAQRRLEKLATQEAGSARHA